tara:strand:- start:4093 stop:5511 length:1419 start_codon:yes stop_codon:yes gene_type:complete
MRNITLIDYLKDLREKFNPFDSTADQLKQDGIVNSHALHDSIITNEANQAMGTTHSPTNQREYYRSTSMHRFGKDFRDALDELNSFLSKYPEVPKQLLTVAQNDESGFPVINATSDDEKEIHEWNNKPLGNDNISVPHECAFLHDSNSVHIVKNPNWRALEDPDRMLEADGLSFTDNNKWYSDDTQSPMDILKAYLSGKPLVFKSSLDSNLTGHVEDGENRVTFEIYPSLHPRVKRYLGLLKKFFGLVLKIEGIKYNAIDIIPINNDDIAIYIATNLAEDINAHYKVMSKIEHNVNYIEGNLMSRIASAYNWIDFQGQFDEETGEYVNDVDEGYFTDDSLYFTFYTRDRGLRFQSIMSSRLERIKDNIRSLNKLHNPTNYTFEKEDFEKASNVIVHSLEAFKRQYEDYFATKEFKPKDKVVEENERLRKEIEEYKKRLEQEEETLRKKVEQKEEKIRKEIEEYKKEQEKKSE